MMRNAITALVFATATLPAVPAWSQQDAPSQDRAWTAPTGLSLGLFSNNVMLIHTGDTETAWGGGIGLSVGYGFSERFSLHLTSHGSWMLPDTDDSYALTHVDVEGRYAFRSTGSRWAPSIAAGITARTGQFDVPVAQGSRREARTSAGATVGGGIGFQLSPSVTLDGGLRYTFGNFNRSGCPSTAGERECATSVRSSVGVIWHPRAQ